MRHYFITTLLGLLVSPFVLPAQAQSNFSLKSVNAYIEGTSTLHDWKSEITKIDFKGAAVHTNNTPQSLKDVEVRIPVLSIKSKEGKIMDNKTYEAFKSDKNPLIIYTFKSSDIKMDSVNRMSIAAAGDLTMAGTTKPVALTARGKIMPNGDWHVSVSKKLRMTDFNMQPPTAVLGTIKVGNDVTVTFDMILQQTKLPDGTK